MAKAKKQIVDKTIEEEIVIVVCRGGVPKRARPLPGAKGSLNTDPPKRKPKTSALKKFMETATDAQLKTWEFMKAYEAVRRARTNLKSYNVVPPGTSPLLSANWRKFDKARIQADKADADYESWIEAQFASLKEWATNWIPQPNQLHGDKAYDRWNEAVAREARNMGTSQTAAQARNVPQEEEDEYVLDEEEIENQERLLDGARRVAKAQKREFDEEGHLITGAISGLYSRAFVEYKLKKSWEDIYNADV